MQPIERDVPTRPDDIWPALPQAAWSETCATLQLWMQIVGKVRLALMPKINHTWNVTLYPTVRGLTTSPMPYGTRMLQIDFDFIDHTLVLETSEGRRSTLPLKPMTVAAFYQQVMVALEELQTPVSIWPVPVEVAEPVPFEKDETHQAYDPESAQRFWRILLQTTRVFTNLSGSFYGQGESDSSVLGSARSGLHTLLRTSGTGASEHGRLARSCDAGCLFARGQ